MKLPIAAQFILLPSLQRSASRSLKFFTAHAALWIKGSKEFVGLIAYYRHLELWGIPCTLNLGVRSLFISLRKEFDSFVQNYNMHSMGKTIYELQAMLKLYEQTLPKNNAPVLHAIRAGKV
ncbi:hypothetical protein Tco_0795475 [Tanacetum coccineum]